MSMKLPRLNSIIVSGRLTRDGETKFLSNGTAVYNCSVAIDDGYFDKKTNQWVNQPVFMDVAVWGKQAEKIGNEIFKGSPVIVEGKLKQNAYTTQDGQNRRVTQITANKISCLEYADDEDGKSQYKSNDNYSQDNSGSNNSSSGGNGGGRPNYVNSDVPFI